MELRDICLPEKLLRLQGSYLENFFFTILFPPLLLAGLIGNGLNLTVLLSSETRNRRTGNPRANALLVSLAICDMLFLLLMLPHSLANFDEFGLNYTFRSIYLPLKVHLLSLANWCSAVAIWLVIAICAERLIGIRSLASDSPFSYKAFWSAPHVISMIVFVSGALTFYNHFSYHCVIKKICNHSQVISKCFDVVQDSWPGNRTNISPWAVRQYVRWSIVLNVAFVIIIPIFVMVALNIALLCAVRSQSFLIYNRLLSAATSETSRNNRQSSLDRGDASNYVDSTAFRRSIDQNMQIHAEHRVTITVCAIVTCFTFTQGPSAIVLFLDFLWGNRPPFVNSNVIWYHANILAGFLVVIGKTLNFILFCLSSATFRRRLVTILGHKTRYLFSSKKSSLISHAAAITPPNPKIINAAKEEQRRFSLF